MECGGTRILRQKLGFAGSLKSPSTPAFPHKGRWEALASHAGRTGR